MKNQIKYITTLVSATLLLVLCQGGLQAQTATINFIPSEIEVEVSEPFFVEVSFDTDNTPISVFDLHMLFDANYLEVLSIEILEGDLFNYHQAPSFDNAAGKMDMAAFQIGKTIPGLFSVIKVELMPLAATDLTQVIHVTESFPKTLLAYGGENVLGETGNLKVTITDAALGLNDKILTEEFDLEVWPNPASDIANITFISDASEQMELSIFDANGKLIEQVFSGNVTAGVENKFEINLSNFSSGNYTCRLVAGQKVQAKKLNVVR